MQSDIIGIFGKVKVIEFIVSEGPVMDLQGFWRKKMFCQYVHACAELPVFPGHKHWQSPCSGFWYRVDMHAGSATESGKYIHHTSPLSSYCQGKPDKRDGYKLYAIKF